MKKLMSIMCFLLILSMISACRKPKLDNWMFSMPVIGTNSSPRVADLNGDGIKDIVLGAGRNEFQPTQHGILALNGATGDTLWTLPSRNQVFGSPVFLDITQDGISDVFIVGRAHQFYAINGSTGTLIWEYELQSDQLDPKGLARFNFYNPIVIEDYSNDGIPDFLVTNGGNVYAPPGDNTFRYPGVLMIMNSANGEIMAIDTVPDGRETYVPPVYVDLNNDGRKGILFCTGGETLTGALYYTDMSNLLSNDLSNSTKIIEYNNDHGFVAPLVIVDMNLDGYLDIISLDHGGIVTVSSGDDFHTIWKIEFDNMELNAQASVGLYDRDQYPDIFVNGATGVWPENTGSRQYFINGKNGEILSIYNIGCIGFSSPVSTNLDGDPEDEVLLPVNQYNCKLGNALYSTTWLHFFEVDTSYQLLQTMSSGKNVSSTLWIGDLDEDSLLDVIYIVNENVRIIYEYLGLRVKRLELDVKTDGRIPWNSYMGNDGNSIFTR